MPPATNTAVTRHGSGGTGNPFYSFQAYCQSNPVAFTVGRDSHITLTDKTVIPFAVGITNNANARIEHGVFTCTSAGLYEFQVYCLSDTDNQLFLELFHNDALVASLWGHSSNTYAAAGNVVVLSLDVGDTVKVQSSASYSMKLYGQPGEIYTTFTGVQLTAHGTSSLAAMSVTLTHDLDVNGGSSVRYNNILVDTSNGYDARSGVYTTPTSGQYLFHFFSSDKEGREIYQDLYHNNNYVCTIYGQTDNAYSDAGNSVILHMAAGDHVTIKAKNHEMNSLLGTPTEIFSTFSSVQLSQDGHTSTGPFVSFSAGVSQKVTVAKGATVKFDHIFTNVHHPYNRATGNFVAPVSGVYEFNYHALGQRDSELWLELYHNSKYVNALYDQTYGFYPAAGNAAVLKLHAGDTVHVKAPSAVYLYGGDQEMYCTFSGYLLHGSSGSVITGK